MSGHSGPLTCVILQPSFIPWRGYFHQIRRSDIFVFYDDVQYDQRGWRNRNRIKSAQGASWLTVPVQSKGLREQGTPIDRVRIDWRQDWTRKHRESIRHAYARAPFLARYWPLVEEIYGVRDELLAGFTIAATLAVARELGLTRTRFLRSSTLAVGGAKTDRLLAILRAVNAGHYLSGPSARDYLEVEKLTAAGISLEFMVYDYPEYPQLHPPYEPQVSILDLLFMMGPAAPRYIWGGVDPEGAPRSREERR